MTYDVAIKLPRDKVLPDVFDWLEGRDLHFIQDWEYSKPDYFKDDRDYTFKFKKSEHATMFALVWA